MSLSAVINWDWDLHCDIRTTWWHGEVPICMQLIASLVFSYTTYITGMLLITNTHTATCISFESPCDWQIKWHITCLCFILWCPWRLLLLVKQVMIPCRSACCPKSRECCWYCSKAFLFGQLVSQQVARHLPTGIIMFEYDCIVKDGVQ